jgi:hypothetical protein
LVDLSVAKPFSPYVPPPPPPAPAFAVFLDRPISLSLPHPREPHAGGEPSRPGGRGTTRGQGPRPSPGTLPVSARLRAEGPAGHSEGLRARPKGTIRNRGPAGPRPERAGCEPRHLAAATRSPPPVLPPPPTRPCPAPAATGGARRQAAPPAGRSCQRCGPLGPRSGAGPLAPLAPKDRRCRRAAARRRARRTGGPETVRAKRRARPDITGTWRRARGARAAAGGPAEPAPPAPRRPAPADRMAAAAAARGGDVQSAREGGGGEAATPLNRLLCCSWSWEVSRR